MEKEFNGKSAASSPPGKRIVLAIALVSACIFGANAAGLSSLTVGGYFDNNAAPSVRFSENGTASVVLAGEWFDSGVCELLVDGVAVASSSGTAYEYSLSGLDDTWRTYRLTLKSDECETTRFITFCPSEADFSRSLHNLSIGECFLDSRPAGTVRKVKFSETVPVAWSGIWNDGAEGAVVNLYAGYGTGGTNLGALVSVEGAREGVYPFSPSALSLVLGDVYTITHFDGIETLTAYFRAVGDGFALIFR